MGLPVDRNRRRVTPECREQQFGPDIAREGGSRMLWFTTLQYPSVFDHGICSSDGNMLFGLQREQAECLGVARKSEAIVRKRKVTYRNN